MDWSAVYDNHGGEEGRWEMFGETRCSRVMHQILHRTLSLPQEQLQRVESNYTPLIAYFFTVNYILGVGSLGVPYAVYSSGILLGNAMIIFVSILSYMTVMWVAETVVRYRLDSKLYRYDEKSIIRPITAQVHDAFPEVTQLCNRFLGGVGSRMYQVSLLALTYGALVGYSQVFVNSFLSQLPKIGSFTLGTGHAAIFFALFVIPLACADLTEQLYLQLTMSIVRFLALIIMISSALYGMYFDPVDSGDDHDVIAPYISGVEYVNLSGFGIMFSTGVFSQLFQHSVPGLLAPLAAKDQKKAHGIFQSTLLTTSFFYMALGTVCALYFGSKLSPSVNLNWANFSWGLKTESTQTIPFFAQSMASLVVIFPALDTLSVFPLIAVTLGDNLAALFPPTHYRESAEIAWRRKIVFRLIAAVPPLVLSTIFTNLSLTLQFSGLAGIYVAFIAPALLQLNASRKLPDATIYSGWFSSLPFVYGVLVFAVCAIIILLYQLRSTL